MRQGLIRVYFAFQIPPPPDFFSMSAHFPPFSPTFVRQLQPNESAGLILLFKVHPLKVTWTGTKCVQRASCIHTHTPNANKRHVWNSVITEHSRLSTSKAGRTGPPLIWADNCTASAHGKGTKGGGKAHKPVLWKQDGSNKILFAVFILSHHMLRQTVHTVFTHMLHSYASVREKL